MRVSVNPSYYCNFRCSFCYLTEEQLADKKTAFLSEIVLCLDEIVQSGRTIDAFDVYGGEIFELEHEYQELLIKILKRYGPECINVITNLSRTDSPLLKDPDIEISVSYDFEARNMHERVFENIMSLDIPVHVLMLASRDVLELDPTTAIQMFNMCENVDSVEIKPYSSNQANQLGVTNTEFEELVYSWLTNPIEKEFLFTNEVNIERVLSDEANSFSDDHVYITPSGKFAVLEFDENNNEFFLELSNFSEYIEWTEDEKARVEANPVCSKCTYKGKCLSEHIRDDINLADSCSGFINLIEKMSHV